MSPDLAQRIQDWLDAEDTSWEASTEVVEWARAYGADVERAWAECPRADFLMAIAGALRIDPDLVVRASNAAAREAVTLLPAKATLPRKAVHLAERYQPGRELEGAASLMERTMALVEKPLDIEEARLRKALHEATPAATKALSQAGMSLLFEPATRELFARHHEAIAAGEIPAEVLASVAGLLDRTLKDKAVEKLRARMTAWRRVLADGHAVRAAASSLIVAASADYAFKCLELVGSLVKNERATEDTLLRIDKAAKIARRSGARVYSEAALVFEHAAAAHGGVAATGDDAWKSSISALLKTMLYAAGGAALDRESTPVHGAVLDAFAAERKTAKLAEYAERIRSAVPRSALRDPAEEARSAAEQDPRGALLSHLESFAPLVSFLDHPEVAEAIELAQAILRATGPVDRKALAQALRTVHERVDTMFRERAGATTDSAHEQARAGIANAAEAVREMDEVLMRFGFEKPS